MAHITSEKSLNPTDQKLMELLQHGDDFLKIELLRPAKSYYERALGLDPNNSNIRKKIEECDRLLAFEKKVIWILTAVSTGLVVLFFLLKS